MSIYLLLLLVPPLLIVLGMKWYFGDTIDIREMAVQALIPVVLISAVWGISRFSATRDTEILNGEVTGKEKDWVSCSHSYSCNCRTVTSGSGSNQTSSTVCDTCYEHNNDWNWNVATTAGSFRIDRIDRRGSYEPPRWTSVEMGQPVAMEHGYTNYVQAAPESLFNMSLAKGAYKGKLPKYPRTYDYQYADRVIAHEIAVPDIDQWNNNLALTLRQIGPAKQANITVVLTKNTPDFADALRSQWIGGKKNDITIVVGTAYPAIKWVRVFSWAKQDIINVALRNDLMESKTLDSRRTVDMITRDVMEYYQRKPMKDFEYLAEDATPPVWVMVLALIIGCAASIFAGMYFHQNDVFGVRRFRRY